ncbi:MAG: hypothetical protein U9Q81_21355 [Pseudomonadota bacterium]|nr:hypothetical protein [Pseudomonadota bacterium]
MLEAFALSGSLPTKILKDHRTLIRALPEATTWAVIEEFYEGALSSSWQSEPEMRFARADEAIEQLPAWRAWTRQTSAQGEVLSIYRVSVPGLGGTFLIIDYLALQESGDR